jgi:Ca2+-binding EF-hand superfamily protein
VDLCGTIAALRDPCTFEKCYCDGYPDGNACPNYDANCTSGALLLTPAPQFKPIGFQAKDTEASAATTTILGALVAIIVFGGLVVALYRYSSKKEAAGKAEEMKLEQERHAAEYAQKQKVRAMTQEKAAQAEAKSKLNVGVHKMKPMTSLSSMTSMASNGAGPSNVWGAPEEPDVQAIEEEESEALFGVFSLEDLIQTKGYILGEVDDTNDGEYLIVEDVLEDDADDLCNGWARLGDVVVVPALAPPPLAPPTPDDATHAALKEIFNEVDSNSDGHLTVDELKYRIAKSDDASKALVDILVKLGLYDRSENIDAWFKQVFDQVDADKDRKIDLEEFTQAIMTRKAPADEVSTEDRVRAIFNRADGNNDGHLSKKEFIARLDGGDGHDLETILQNAGLLAYSAECFTYAAWFEQALDKLDTDKNGKIEKEEFVKAIINALTEEDKPEPAPAPAPAPAPTLANEEEVTPVVVVAEKEQETEAPESVAVAFNKVRTQLEALFNQGDTGSKDGTLTKEEFTHRLEKANGDGAFTKLLKEADLFVYFDKDGDGKLSFKEMLEFADKDGNGKIERVEFMDAFKKAQLKKSGEDVDHADVKLAFGVKAAAASNADVLPVLESAIPLTSMTMSRPKGSPQKRLPTRKTSASTEPEPEPEPEPAAATLKVPPVAAYVAVANLSKESEAANIAASKKLAEAEGRDMTREELMGLGSACVADTQNRLESMNFDFSFGAK